MLRDKGLRADYCRITLITGMTNEEHRFRSVIEAARGGGAVARIPQDVTAKLGGLKQMRITGTLNGTPFRSSTMPYRGAFSLGVHKATREAAGVQIGDEVELTVLRDDSPRVLELAPELEAAFTKEPQLRERFERLSFSRRRELAEPIAEARRPETRAARLEKALLRLRELDLRELD
jgi:bifunctional DNA-binding transcriptional regulator/antitoxin component of YhaV-PrlF toxin-antitoxin module